MTAVNSTPSPRANAGAKGYTMRSRAKVMTTSWTERGNVFSEVTRGV